MFCKYCGKEIDDDASFCSYCGKNIKPVAKREEDAPKTSGSAARLSKRAIAVIVIVVVAAVAAAGIGIFLYNRDADAGRVVFIEQPKLSEANVEAGNQVLEATDAFLNHEWGSLFPSRVKSEIEEIRNTIVVPDEEDASYDITMQLIDYILEIETGIEKGTAGNVVNDWANEEDTIGPEWDALREARDALERFIEENS